MRTVLDGLSAARLGVTEKRLANIRSLVTKAVERFGQRRTWVTKEIPLSPAWQDLLARIEGKEHRWGLGRLACYGTVKGIDPARGHRRDAPRLLAALEAEELVKDPRGLLKHTIAVWNMCRKRVPGWPELVLASPFKTTPAMLPLEAFPASFQADVARLRGPHAPSRSAGRDGAGPRAAGAHARGLPLHVPPRRFGAGAGG